jgi:hypothetical protein
MSGVVAISNEALDLKLSTLRSIRIELQDLANRSIDKTIFGASSTRESSGNSLEAMVEFNKQFYMAAMNLRALVFKTEDFLSNVSKDFTNVDKTLAGGINKFHSMID